ncbi:hypothetical protein RLW55_01260 [Hyphomicrobium sp. B1]|uniref:hypothetical protein n=1 Tax=unclassified Hyphomicrobium TaxID=2619925 RepID=UPI003919B016
MTSDAKDMRDFAKGVLRGDEGLPAMDFTADGDGLDRLAYWTTRFRDRAGAHTGKQRALFVRKFALYLIRMGLRDNPRHTYLLGTDWFAATPVLLESTLSFGGAVRLHRQDCQRRINLLAPLPETEILADLARPLVPKPVIGSHDAFVMEKLVHARHLVETGMRFDNCLKVRGHNGYLPNPIYWSLVKHRTTHLYVVRHLDNPCLLIDITLATVRQMQHLAPPPALGAVMAVFEKALVNLHGPLATAGGRSLLGGTATETIRADPNQLTLLPDIRSPS